MRMSKVSEFAGEGVAERDMRLRREQVSGAERLRPQQALM